MSRGKWDDSWTNEDKFCRACWRDGKVNEVKGFEAIDGNEGNIAPWNWQGVCGKHE